MEVERDRLNTALEQANTRAEQQATVCTDVNLHLQMRLIKKISSSNF